MTARWMRRRLRQMERELQAMGPGIERWRYAQRIRRLREDLRRER